MWVIWPERNGSPVSEIMGTEKNHRGCTKILAVITLSVISGVGRRRSSGDYSSKVILFFLFFIMKKERTAFAMTGMQ